MKNILILLLFSLVLQTAYSDDSASAYKTQRDKINKLLDKRSEKFGQYENSVTMRTGIFGLKTKKDMQRSNDILTEIIKTDNVILKELKILFDYKDFEKTTVETRAVTSESRISNYMQTITKLQNQLEKLTKNNTKVEEEKDKFEYYKYAFFASIAVIAFLIYKIKS